MDKPNSYLFVCSRPSYNITRKKGVLGFLDTAPTLNNILKSINPGDLIFFYITKEKILDGYCEVTKPLYFDLMPLYPHRDDICASRVSIKMKVSNAAISFQKYIVPFVSFIPKERKPRATYTSFMVTNLIRLTPDDAKMMLLEFQRHE